MLRNLQKANNTVTIVDGAAISDSVIIPVGYAIAAIEVPTSWTSADLGFAFNTTGTTFVDMYAGAGTTVARLRVTGIPTAAASFVLVPIQLHEIALGVAVKLTSINVASNADAAQTGDIVLTVWVGRAN